jgi:hypothetical protein
MSPFRPVLLIIISGLALLPSERCDAGVYENKYFLLPLPDGLIVKQLVQAEDYKTYAVMDKNGKCLVNFYLGDAPDYPKEDKRSGIYETHFSSDCIDMVSGWKGERLIARKLLINLHPKGLYPWPIYLMVWTGDLQPEEMQVADRLISSIQCKKD